MSRFELLNDAEEVLYEDADKFEPYPNERIRLKPHTGEKYEQLKASIIANGIIQPIIAMPSSKRGMLVCISGMNRCTIAKELNIQVPYQLKNNLTKDQADSICIDTNLLNRQLEEYKYSELGFILKTKYEILKHQGVTTTSRNDCTKLMESFNIKRRSIQYYIRLTYLNDELLKMVDDSKINFIAGVSISYLKNEEQYNLMEYLNTNNYKLTPKIAEHLKKLSQESKDNINVKNVLDELNKTVDKNIKPIKFTIKELSDYIPKSDMINSRQIIFEALKQFYSKA
jgi:ParB family chromosome partitioning protein